jgi:ADP-heptose:LPS heptosyltransferase
MNLNIKKIIDLYIGGFLILVLRPITILLGKILKRNHDPSPHGDIIVIKMLGGGSLVIAAAALLAIKRTYPHRKLRLVTTPGIAPFAKSLGVFDEILMISDKSFFSMVLSSLKILKKLFRTDTILDYEVYSRLTTIFALITCARNRVGFYRESVEARKNFSTHIVYFNLYYGSWYFYEQLSKLIGCSIPSDVEVRDHFLKLHSISKSPVSEKVKIGIGHGCSDLSLERMLSPEEWKVLASRRLQSGKSYEFHFYGVKKDGEIANQIISQLKNLPFTMSFHDHCGETNLAGSIKAMSQMDEFWAIDSSLLHYSRLMGIKTVSVFGPTSPQSLIKPLSYLEEEILYEQIPCSPCVHVTEDPPCNGNNICIKNLFKSST